MEFTEQDAALITKVAQRDDRLERLVKKLSDRLDHLKSHLHDDPEPPPIKNHLHINVTLSKASSPAATQHKMEQFRLELLSLLEEYGVQRLDGSFERQ